MSLIVDQRLHAPADEGADFAIRMGGRPWPGFTCVPLMDDELYPVVSPAYWAAHDRPRTPQDLQRLRLLHDRDPNASWALWKKHHGPPALDTRIGPRRTSSDLVLAGAEQGLGVALARHRLAGDAIGSGTLLRPFGDTRLALPLPGAHRPGTDRRYRPWGRTPWRSTAEARPTTCKSPVGAALRFVPALNVSDAEIAEMLDVLDGLLKGQPSAA